MLDQPQHSIQKNEVNNITQIIKKKFPSQLNSRLQFVLQHTNTTCVEM